MQQESWGNNWNQDLISSDHPMIASGKAAMNAYQGTTKWDFIFGLCCHLLKVHPIVIILILAGLCLVASKRATDKNFPYEMTSNKMGFERQTVWSSSCFGTEFG